MDFGNCFRFSRFWFYRLARSRSPKPPGFGAGEAQLDRSSQRVAPFQKNGVRSSFFV